ncbi:3-keto-5-aminohexanoate cleavage protein [Streptomyces sp. NPDC059917]|uniref:3-keto-5-aminohexanoate cleavage protein n=1 Tax=Streptomyces sp. NPDC059917 TaxID=3347002 RepID=UPI003658AD95
MTGAGTGAGTDARAVRGAGGVRPDRVRLQVSLNGSRTAADGAAVPMSPRALVESALRSVAAGAAEVLVRPRTPCGRESLSPRVVGPVLRALREGGVAVPLVVCASVGAEPDPGARVARVRSWEVLPDRAEVHCAEPGAVDLAAALAERGVAVDAVVPAGVGGGAGAGPRVVAVAGAARLVVEVGGAGAGGGGAGGGVDGSGAGGVREVLVYGRDGAAWGALLRGAGVGPHRWVRTGLGDVLLLPDGRPARSNEELVAAALGLLATGTPRYWGVT